MTKHFKFEEFTSRGFPTRPSKKEQYLLERLAYRLECAMEVLGCAITITDCYRSYEKYQAMVYDGLFPSETSDHFWGQRVPVATLSKIEKYGTSYDMSVGAVYFRVSMDINEAYTRLLSAVKNSKFDVGQLIIEKSKTAQWIHMSNPAGVLYNTVAAMTLIPKRTMFLASNDGGKTYEAVA